MANLETNSLQLERLVASAQDLIQNARHRDELSSQYLVSVLPDGEKNALPPPCTEPYCGGWHWNWTPSRPPQPLQKPYYPDMAILQPVLSAGRKRGPKVMGKKLIQSVDIADMYPHASPELAKALEAYEHLKAKVLNPNLQGGPRKLPVVKDDNGEIPLDYYQAEFFPPLQQPIAKRVQLLPANIDKYPTHLVDKPVILKLKNPMEMRDPQHFAGFSLFDHINDFMRVKPGGFYHEGEAKEVRGGQRLLAVRPKDHDTLIAPFFGKDELEKLSNEPKYWPVELTFGGKPSNENRMPEDSPPVLGVKKAYETVPVKRLDIVLKSTERTPKKHKPLFVRVPTTPPPKKDFFQDMGENLTKNFDPENNKPPDKAKEEAGPHPAVVAFAGVAPMPPHWSSRSAPEIHPRRRRVRLPCEPGIFL